MPLSDPRAGTLYIWVITCVLLLAILAGGSFLVLYISAPQSESTSWLPVAGVLLVCLPWLFWLVTIVYRLFSRACGFRMGGGGGYGPAGNEVRGGGGSGAGSLAGSSAQGGASSVHDAATDGSSDAAGAVTSPVTSPAGGSNTRRVHFGGAVVVGDQDAPGGLERKMSEKQSRSLSSSNSSNDISIQSNESELPLTLSMAS